MAAETPPATVRPATAEDYEAVARLNAEVQQLHAEALPHLFKPAAARAFTREFFDGLRMERRLR